MTLIQKLSRAAGLILSGGCLLLAAGWFLLSWLGGTESRYADYAEADAARLFARGWLPSIIPGSSRAIVTRNDLDLNTSSGGFHFDREDLDAFLSRLERIPDLDSDRFDAYRFDDWVFLVSSNGNRVECEYRFRLKQ